MGGFLSVRDVRDATGCQPGGGMGAWAGWRPAWPGVGGAGRGPPGCDDGGSGPAPGAACAPLAVRPRPQAGGQFRDAVSPLWARPRLSGRRPVGGHPRPGASSAGRGPPGCDDGGSRPGVKGAPSSRRCAMAFGHPGLPSLHRYCLLRGRPPERGPGDPPAAGPGRPPAAGRWAVAGRGRPGMSPAPAQRPPGGGWCAIRLGMGAAPAQRPPGGVGCAIASAWARPRLIGRRPVGGGDRLVVRPIRRSGRRPVGRAPSSPAHRPQAGG